MSSLFATTYHFILTAHGSTFLRNLSSMSADVAGISVIAAGATHCARRFHKLSRVSTTQEWVILNFEGGTDIGVGIVPESDEQPEAAIFHASNGDMFFL